MGRVWLIVVIVGASCQRRAPAGDVATTNALTPDTHAAFPVAHDTVHAGVDCNACHGDFDTFTQFSCTSGCHDQAECDPLHPGLEGYKHESQACFSCHPSGTSAVDLATHPFPIDASAVHTNIACKSCHTGAGYAEFSCTTGCHAQATTDADHTGIDGYTFASPSCLECHPQGVADTAISHPKFPIGTGTRHAGIGCSQCHLDRSKTSDASQYQCATCHAAVDPTLITRHTTTTSKPSVHLKANEISVTDARTCLRCHPAAKVDLTKNHPTRRPCPGDGSPPHKGAGCTECHSGYQATPSYAAEFAGTTPPGCAQCHENNQVCH